MDVPRRCLMSFCVTEVRLLKKLGKERAAKLLPPALRLVIYSHDTGCQCYITSADGAVVVWSGSEWYNSCYEFNDTGKHPGLQPDCGFAELIIDDFFLDVAQAVSEMDRRAAIEKTQAQSLQDARRAKDIARLREQLLPRGG
jgi:hypothetical protein